MGQSVPDPDAATERVSADPQQPSESAAEKRRRDYRTIVLAAVIVLAVALAAVLGAELYIRKRIAREVNAATTCLVQDGASVSFGPVPLMAQYLSKHINKITIRTAGNQIAQAKKMAVAITVRDISLHKEGDSLGTIGRMDVEVNWPTEGMNETMSSMAPSMLGPSVGKVTTSGATGLITVQIAGGLASVTTKPVVKNGQLELESENVTAMIGLPRELAQPGLDMFTKGIGSQYPMGLQTDEVKVTDDGLLLKMSTTNQPMKPVDDPCLSNLQRS